MKSDEYDSEIKILPITDALENAIVFGGNVDAIIELITKGYKKCLLTEDGKYIGIDDIDKIVEEEEPIFESYIRDYPRTKKRVNVTEKKFLIFHN